VNNSGIYHIMMIFICIFLACRTERKPSGFTEEKLSENSEKLVEMNKILVKKDAERIEAFVDRQNWDMLETQTGLWYMIYHRGEGAEAQPGMIATINYSITLLDGTECYSSDETGPRQFKIGQGGVESGLEEGILLMHEGDKARFIMPPHLAHGLVGDNNKIPPRAIILYEVELIKLDEK
jgi:FKBP-type peptidyl-prolyl cis-trans isomerase FkpA